MADIYIADARLTPDTVITGRSFILSVEIKDKVFAILDSSGRYLMTQDNKAIEKNPRK